MNDSPRRLDGGKTRDANVFARGDDRMPLDGGNELVYSQQFALLFSAGK